MRAELVSIATPAEPLDGLYYAPQGRAPVGAVLLMHGNCKNFYTGPSRFLVPDLLAAGFAVLAFNRRGHDVMYTHGRDGRGGAFQLAAEMIEDNALAAEWLAARGHPAPAVVGHSNGGMLAVAHVAARPETPALVLLSAHRGGRELAGMISAKGLFGGDRLEELTAEAEALVGAGRGDTLMLLPGWWHVSSAASFLDYARNLPAILELAPQIRCPSLFLRGGLEDPEIYPAEAFAGRTAGPASVRVIPDCDHFYTGQEAPVAAEVAGWLAAQFEEAPAP